MLVYSTGTGLSERSRSYSLRDAISASRIKIEAHLGIPLDADGVPLANNVLINDEYFMDAVNAVCESNEISMLDLESHPELTAKLVEDPPTRGYGIKPHSCLICPIQPTSHNGVVAILVLGVNPRRPYDSQYDAFVKGLTRTISTALASVLLVNEQKRLASQAAEMEQRALAMVEVSPVGSFLMDMDGKMLYVNDSVRRPRQFLLSQRVLTNCSGSRLLVGLICRLSRTNRFNG